MENVGILTKKSCSCCFFYDRHLKVRVIFILTPSKISSYILESGFVLSVEDKTKLIDMIFKLWFIYFLLTTVESYQIKCLIKSCEFFIIFHISNSIESL